MQMDLHYKNADLHLHRRESEVRHTWPATDLNLWDPLKQAEDVHIMQINGDYVLLGTDSGDVYYLYNLQDETYRELDIPEEIQGTLEMYIAKKEKKLLLTNEKEAYLVNLK